MGCDWITTHLLLCHFLLLKGPHLVILKGVPTLPLPCAVPRSSVCFPSAVLTALVAWPPTLTITIASARPAAAAIAAATNTATPLLLAIASAVPRHSLLLSSLKRQAGSDGRLGIN